MPPCVAKTCAERPVFAQLVGELWAADPSKRPRAHEAKASSGAQSEAPRRSWKSGHQQHVGPENRDSQHMLNQPRVVSGLFGTAPPDPTLESASPFPPQGSIWHRIGSNLEIDVESMPNRPLSLRRGRSGGSVPNKTPHKKKGVFP